MSESVSLPALGESVTEGTVTRWLKNVGDQVEVDEPLLEVSTDKVDTEIPSPVAGTIEKILVQEDETVEVGTALVTIGDGSGGGSDETSDDEAAAESAEPKEEAPAAEEKADDETDEEAEEKADEAPEEEAEEKADEAPEEQTEEKADEAPEEQTEEKADEAPEEQANEAPEEEPSAEKTEEAAAEESAVATENEKADEAPAESADDSDEKPTEEHAEKPTEDESAERESTEKEAEAPSAPAPSDSQSAQTHAAQTQAAQAGYVTPIVRKLAAERGIDLAGMTGTGIGGRIRKEDILSAQAAPGVSHGAAAPVVVSDLRGTTQSMSRLRKVVADRAVVSMQTSAQLTSVVEVDVTKIAALRDRVKADFQAKTGNKLSFLPFFALAATEALKTYPVINATVDGESIVYPGHENLSIAVDTERGLLTPVIRNAGELNLAELAAQVADLADRTRNNKLKPDELAGGTFTLTNTGSRGALFDTPIVFLPQVAILGTGIVRKAPVVVSVDGSDAIAVRSTVFLALSYDHRIVDGADAARFLVQVKNRLEDGAFEGNLGI